VLVETHRICRKQVGLLKFIPPSATSCMKSKEVKKCITSHLKELEKISVEELKRNFFELLVEKLPLYSLTSFDVVMVCSMTCFIFSMTS
jgi:hypothetical protein